MLPLLQTNNTLRTSLSRHQVADGLSTYYRIYRCRPHTLLLHRRSSLASGLTRSEAASKQYDPRLWADLQRIRTQAGHTV